MRHPERWVLLHGTPLTPAVWNGVARRLSEHGPVTTPKLVASSATDEAQRDLAEHVRQVLPAGDRLRVVGHSFGGQVALDLALLVPERLASLTLVCSRDTPYPPFAAAADRLRSSGVGDPEPGMGRWFRPAEVQAGGAVLAYARQCLQNADPIAWANALDAIARYDRSADVGRVTAPVRLIAAELDSVSTPQAMADLAGRLPDAELHVLAGAAHMSPFVDPDRLARLLLSETGR